MQYNKNIAFIKIYCTVILFSISISVAKGKTVTIRVSEETFDEVKQVCSDLGDSYNFNQFVNQSLSAILDVIRHQGSDIPVPKFAMMARLMREFEAQNFSRPSEKK